MAELFDQVDICQDQEWLVAQVGQVGLLVWIFNHHLLDKVVTVSILLCALLLHSLESVYGSHKHLQGRVHGLVSPDVQIQLDEEAVEDIGQEQPHSHQGPLDKGQDCLHSNYNCVDG